VYQLTGSTLGTAYAFLIELAPAVLLAPLAAYLADRVNRRALLMVVSLTQAAALLPTLVGPDQLLAANSLVGLNQNLGRLIGGPLGGLLLAFGELRAIVAVDSASFLLALLLIARVRATPAAAAPASSAHRGSRAAPASARTRPRGGSDRR